MSPCCWGPGILSGVSSSRSTSEAFVTTSRGASVNCMQVAPCTPAGRYGWDVVAGIQIARRERALVMFCEFLPSRILTHIERLLLFTLPMRRVISRLPDGVFHTKLSKFGGIFLGQAATLHTSTLPWRPILSSAEPMTMCALLWPPCRRDLRPANRSWSEGFPGWRHSRTYGNSQVQRVWHKARSQGFSKQPAWSLAKQTA